MANYHNPKTRKTIQAKNRAEAIKKMAEKPKPKPASKPIPKKVSDDSQ